MAATVDLTPRWVGMLQYFIMALEIGTEEGKKIAREELKRMAEAADFAGDLARSGPQLALVFEGGSVSHVVTANPALVGMSYVTIDYDLEGVAPEQSVKVRQADGTDADAYVREHEVTLATIPVGKIASYPPADIDPAEVAWRAEEPTA